MNNQDSNDYEFDAPKFVDLNNYSPPGCEWSDFAKNEPDEDDKENEPINETPNSNGIQRPSLYMSNNKENNINNANQFNSNNTVYEKPATTMKNQKEVVRLHMKNLDELKENDESEVNNEHKEDPIMKDNHQNKPEFVKKPESNAHVKQIVTAYKPKEAQPTNQIPKTAHKVKSVPRPPETLLKKELARPVGPAFLTKKSNNINNAATSTGGRTAPHQASTAAAATIVANTVAREGGKAKMASRPAGICGAIGGASTARKQVNTVPISPNLATSQRANMKKEKSDAKQSATAVTKVMTVDRQGGQSRPPASARTMFPKSATVGRAGDRKPVNCLGRMETEERKEKTQDKPAGRAPQSGSARTAGLPRAANTNSRNPPKHVPVAWNY